MALDPTPGDQPKNLSDILAGAATGKATLPTHVKRDVSKRKAKEKEETQKFTKDQDTLITSEQYFQLMQDRPIKFGATAVGYEKGGGKNGNPCLTCIHYYVSPASNHTTCEIFRISDEQDQVAADDHCLFWSQDGKTFPLLASHQAENQEESE